MDGRTDWLTDGRTDGLMSIRTYFYHSKNNFIVYFSVKWPKSVDFDQPDEQGLEGARNFYLETEPGIRVGVWHIVPRSLVKKSAKKSG